MLPQYTRAVLTENGPQLARFRNRGFFTMSLGTDFTVQFCVRLAPGLLTATVLGSTLTYWGKSSTFCAITHLTLRSRCRGIYSWKVLLLTSLLGKVPSSLYSSQGYPLEATKSKTTCSLLLARKRRSKNSPLGVRMRSLLTDSVLSSSGSGGKDCSRESLIAWGRKNHHLGCNASNRRKGQKAFYFF